MAKVHRSSFSKTLCHHSNLRVKYRHLSSKGCPSYDDISCHMMWCHHRVAPPSCFRFSFTIWATAAFCVLGWGIAGKMLGCGWWANLHIRWCQIISCKHSCSCYPAELQLATYEGCSHECSEGFFHKPLNLSVAVSCEKLANRCRHRNLLTWQKCRMSHFNNSPCANTHPASDVWHLWQVALM